MLIRMLCSILHRKKHRGLLIRMLSSIHKWDGSVTINRRDATICGDAIGDLRTVQNKLSVWKGDTEEDINDAIVALALNRDDVCKIDYLILEEDKIAKMAINIVDDQPGRADGLNNDDAILLKHRDLVEIDYKRLGLLAKYMTDIAKIEKNRKSMTKKEVKDLLNKYKDESRIQLDSMNKKLRDRQ